MENAKVNEAKDTTVICGDGAGFAMQVKENGNLDSAFFPGAGRGDQFAGAINTTVALQRNSPGVLGSRKKILVSEEVDPRNDSLAVSE